MLNLENFKFRYEPYPIGSANNVFSADKYRSLLDAYPDVGLFVHKPENGNKYSLSELNNPELFHKFLDGNDQWGDFARYIKSQRFLDEILALLKQRNIDLGLRKIKWRPNRRKRFSSIWSRIRRETELSARFEFSIMGGDGGHLRPHTDHHNKLITLVLSMCDEDEWKQEWGGGTTVSLPKDRTLVYNQMNSYLDFDEMDDICDYAFVPNQCVLFIKTYNSWHHVAPMKANDPSRLRRTLTINIERLA